MERYHEALYLEFNVLALVIDRNRKQHQRAAYFRRLDMLYRCIQKYMVFLQPFEESSNTTLITILQNVKKKKLEYESLLSRQLKIQKRQRQDQWSLVGANTSKKKDAFLIHLQTLHQSIHQELPEILSRIMFAAEALYKELSRGYFAPLCTVCLACISRIRTLVMRLGRDIYIVLNDVHSWLTGDFQFVKHRSDLEKDVLHVNQVQCYLKECPLMSSVLDRYQDVNLDDYQQKKENLQKKMILNRMPGFKCMIDNDKDEEKNDEVIHEDSQLKEGNTGVDNEMDNIGELVHATCNDSSPTMEEHETTNSSNDFGDTNLEMVQLLKQKNKSKIATTSKKRKLESREDESSDSILIKKKTKSKKKKNKDEDKVKDKKKKKKKKVKRDAIDDIFDGF